jgi:hypothetical protein
MHSVGQRDDPRLRCRPVIVGAGVVLASSFADRGAEWPDQNELLEAWQLATWYLELAVVRLLGYQGEYVLPLRLEGWIEDTEIVHFSTSRQKGDQPKPLGCHPISVGRLLIIRMIIQTIRPCSDTPATHHSSHEAEATCSPLMR